MNNRKSNFELLRIISMFLIVCHHYAIHSEFNFSNTISANKLIIQFLSYGGKLGVNLFVLISGYFLATTDFRPKKAIKLWLNVSIYSLIICIIFLLAGQNMDLSIIMTSLFPVIYSDWYNGLWFVTTYFLLYLLSGYINIFIKSLSQKQLDKLIFTLVVIYSIIPTFALCRMDYSNLTWFFLLYLIAARIRLFPPSSKRIWNHSLVLGIGIYILCIISCFIFDIIGTQIPLFSSNATFFADMDRTPLLLCSIFLFLGFKDLQLKDSSFINLLSSTTFGIYLIHDNLLVRKFLWIDLFKSKQYMDSNILILHAVISILATFITCSIISYIYNITIDKLVNMFLNKYYEKCENTIKTYFKKISSKITL